MFSFVDLVSIMGILSDLISSRCAHVPVWSGQVEFSGFLGSS